VTAADLDVAFARLPAAWAEVLPGWTRERLGQVRDCIAAVSGDRAIAPDDPFRALRLVPPDAVRVVVIGQDPYPTAGHADGLAFSAGTGRPRSLARVFEVLAADRPGFVAPDRWSLDAWAGQGVLLLNPVLTVEVGRSGSHMACGWQALTAEIVRVLVSRDGPPAFLVWGAKAQTFVTDAMARAASATVHATRHPSYDFARRFMAGGSHFEATSHLVDWWGIGRNSDRVL
jgi:uracil-DNA glycosylase